VSTFKILLKCWFPRVWGSDVESGGPSGGRRGGGNPSGSGGGLAHHSGNNNNASDRQFSEFDMPMRKLQPSAKMARRGGKQGINDITLMDTVVNTTRRGSEEAIVRGSSAGSAATTVQVDEKIHYYDDDEGVVGMAEMGMNMNMDMEMAMQRVQTSTTSRTLYSRHCPIEGDVLRAGTETSGDRPRTGTADINRWRTQW
jgi:hypothetical protein